MRPSPSQRWSISRISRAICLAVLLLSGQVKADATTSAGSALSAVEAATIFCHAGHDTDHGRPVLPHHAHEAAVLQTAHPGVHHLAIPAAAQSLPPPLAVQPTRPGVHQARAPPGRLVASAYARGPPHPV